MKTYIGLGIIGIILIGGFFYTQKEDIASEEKFSIVTSFYPLYFFATEIGGEDVYVHNITPAGAEPHEYEPTPRDMVVLEESDLVIINGVIEPWEHDIEENIGTPILVVGEPFMTIEAEEGHHHEEEDFDPHVWLSPRNAIAMVGFITDTLATADPEHAETYRSNAKTLVSELMQLDREYTDALAVCSTRTMVTSHAAFGYLAESYELSQIAIAGISPEGDPSPARMAEIAVFAKEKSITHIFFETLVSPKLADAIATEVGAETLVLNPLEGLTVDEMKSGETYLTVMRANLDNLVRGLSCTL